MDQRAAGATFLCQLDFHWEELRAIELDLSQVGLPHRTFNDLMTVLGLDAAMALAIGTAARDFTRLRILKSCRPTRTQPPRPPVLVDNRPATAGSPGRPGARPRNAHHQLG
jgi:hypothetical protein